MASCFHTGISIWKWVSTVAYMEMGNAHFHMGNQKKWLPVSIKRLPYRNGDWHIPIWKWGMPVFIWGITRNGSPFPYGNLNMETRIVTSPYGNGNSLFPYGDHIQGSPYGNGEWHIPMWKWGVLVSIWWSNEMAHRFHMGIPIQKRGLTHPHVHMGTGSVTNPYRTEFVPIWKLRKKSPYGKNFHMGIAVSVWQSPYGNLRNSNLGTPRYRKE